MGIAASFLEPDLLVDRSFEILLGDRFTTVWLNTSAAHHVRQPSSRGKEELQTCLVKTGTLV